MNRRNWFTTLGIAAVVGVFESRRANASMKDLDEAPEFLKVDGVWMQKCKPELAVELEELMAPQRKKQRDNLTAI